MKHLQLEVQAREKQIIKGYEEPLAAARHQNAEAMVCGQHLLMSQAPNCSCRICHRLCERQGALCMDVGEHNERKPCVICRQNCST